MIVVFCFNNGNRIIRAQVKHIVCTFRLFTGHNVTFEVDTAIRNFCFQRDVLVVPLCRDCGCDVVKLNIFFGHLTL